METTIDTRICVSGICVVEEWNCRNCAIFLFAMTPTDELSKKLEVAFQEVCNTIPITSGKEWFELYKNGMALAGLGKGTCSYSMIHVLENQVTVISNSGWIRIHCVDRIEKMIKWSDHLSPLHFQFPFAFRDPETFIKRYQEFQSQCAGLTEADAPFFHDWKIDRTETIFVCSDVFYRYKDPDEYIDIMLNFDLMTFAESNDWLVCSLMFS